MFVDDSSKPSAGVRQPIVEFASRNPNLRVIEGRFMAIEQAMGMPKGRDTAARYLRGFVEEMKASGFVADALSATTSPTTRWWRRRRKPWRRGWSAAYFLPPGLAWPWLAANGEGAAPLALFLSCLGFFFSLLLLI